MDVVRVGRRGGTFQAETVPGGKSGTRKYVVCSGKGMKCV